MTIVATSMPVLRVFVLSIVTSVIDTYNNSNREKSRNGLSKAATTGADVSFRQSSNSNNRATKSIEMLNRGSERYLELEDLVVDERTGRVTAATPDTIIDHPEQTKSQWPLGT
jgi:hypothetical protein